MELKIEEFSRKDLESLEFQLENSIKIHKMGLICDYETLRFVKREIQKKINETEKCQTETTSKEEEKNIQ